MELTDKVRLNIKRCANQCIATLGCACIAMTSGCLIHSHSLYNLLFVRLSHVLGMNSMLWRSTSLLGNVSEMFDASGSVLKLLIT